MSENNPDCPHCGGVSPSTDGKTECGWCSPDHVPSVVPTFSFDRIFESIWMEWPDGEVDGEDATTLDEDLWTEEGEHPWDGLLYGYSVETHLTYAQTLETPAEYLTVGRLWVTNGDGKELAEVDAGEFQ
jgi:hypothetical protein